MIVLRSPKGWTGPKEVDGKQVEGTYRSHQVPMGEMDKPEHLKILDKLCFLPCTEYTALKKAVAYYKQNGAVDPAGK